MYRLNVVSQNQQQQQQQQVQIQPGMLPQSVAAAASHLIIQQHGHSSTHHILSGIPAGGGGSGGGGTNSVNTGSGQLNGSGLNLPGSSSSNIDEVKVLTAIKSEPMQDVITITAAPATTAASTSATTNGHMVFVPTKRSRLEGPDDWLSSPSPGSVPSSAPPLSPSPGSQSHNFNTNMSNGYASPMSTGSYDPYSPNGKMGKCILRYSWYGSTDVVASSDSLQRKFQGNKQLVSRL